MTELSSTQLQEIRTKVLGAAAKVPGFLIGLGILFIVLGMIGIYGQVFFSFLSVNVLGIFLFAGGILQGAHAFQSSGWKSVSVQMIFAIIYIVGAIYVLIAIELLLQGWSLLFLGFAARSLAKSVANK